jgi:hypothetical protein
MVSVGTKHSENIASDLFLPKTSKIRDIDSMRKF